jgi:hypothetical protein
VVTAPRAGCRSRSLRRHGGFRLFGSLVGRAASETTGNTSSRIRLRLRLHRMRCSNRQPPGRPDPWSTACQTDHVAAGPRVVVRHLTASVACGAMLLTILWPGSTSLLLFLPRTTIQSQVPECFYWFSELVKCPCVATGAQIYFPITCILIFLESISKSFNTSVLISVRYNSYFDD